MILQRDTRFRASIRDYGCYFMDILFLANKHENIPMSVQKINNNIYHGAVQQGFMTGKCYLTDPSGLAKWVGWPAVYTGKHEPPDYECGENEAEILLFTYEKWSHFVVGDGKGNVAYDPWGVSLCATKGELQSKRIFRL